MAEDTSSLPRTKEELALEILGLDRETFMFAMDPLLLDRVLEDIDRRVKHDLPVKLSVFFTGVSSFLREPINLFQKGESGIGKSYNTTQVIRYFMFDKGDVWLLGGLTPKSLVHDYGVQMTEDGMPLELVAPPEKPSKSEYSNPGEYAEALKLYRKKLREYAETVRRSYTLIDLTGKILVFLETPEFEAFHMLYPILSHDSWQVQYRFVDRPKQGSMRTMRVVLQGFPATIFLGVDRKYIEELATRSFTVTPESSSEKITDANKLTNLKASYPWETVDTPESARIMRLLSAIKRWFRSSNADVIVPFENLYELFPKEIVRDMRDFQHYIQLLKAVAALHLFQRPIITVNGANYVVASVVDVALSFEVFARIFETTRTGTEQQLLSFYHDIVALKECWHLNDLVEEYNRVYPRKVSSEWMRVKMERLAEIGYVDIRKDPDDKRLNVYVPLVKGEKSKNLLKTHSWAFLRLNLQEGFKKWREKIQQVGRLEIKKFFEGPISMDTLESMVLDEKILFNYKWVKLGFLTKPEKELETEKKTENNQEKESGKSLEKSSPSTPLSVKPEDVLKLERLTVNVQGECVECRMKGRMDWQVTFHDGTWSLLCGECGFKLSKQLEGES